jgi:hypothetical protein
MAEVKKVNRKEVVTGLRELSEEITKMKNDKEMGAATILKIRYLLENFCGQKMANKCICDILDSIIVQADNGKFEPLLLAGLYEQIAKCIKEESRARVIQLRQNGPCREEVCKECPECKKMDQGGENAR